MNSYVAGSDLSLVQIFFSSEIVYEVLYQQFEK